MAAWWTTSARSDIINGISVGDTAQVLKGVKEIFKNENSDSYDLFEVILASKKPEIIGAFLSFVERGYDPVYSDGIVKPDSSAIIPLLKKFSASESDAELKDKYEALIGRLTVAVDDARERQAEKYSGPPAKHIEGFIGCVHTCSICSPGCPMNWLPPKYFEEKIQKGLSENDIDAVVKGVRKILAYSYVGSYPMVGRALENQAAAKRILPIISRYSNSRKPNVIAGVDNLIAMLRSFAAKNFGSELGMTAKDIADRFQAKVNTAATQKASLKT